MSGYATQRDGWLEAPGRCGGGGGGWGEHHRLCVVDDEEDLLSL